jgi:hypothetical protein
MKKREAWKILLMKRFIITLSQMLTEVEVGEARSKHGSGDTYI